MRVVLDTNVFISGIFWSGDSEKVLLEWGNGKYELIISEEIIKEIFETLSDFKIQLPSNMIILWLSILSFKSIIVDPKEKIDIVEDPDDNKFIEAAFESDASYIVTQDKHLLKIKEHKGIKILTPEKFLIELKE